MKINFSNENPSATKLMIVPVFDGCELGPKAKQLDLELGGLLSQRMQTKENFHAKAGQPLRLSVDPVHGMQDIVLLGMGKAEDMDEDAARKLSGALKAAITNVGEDDISVLADTVENMPISSEVFAAHLMDAYVASKYEFTKYKSKAASDSANDNENQPSLTAIVDNADVAQKLYAPLKTVTDSANWAKDLGNEPPNKLTPVAYAKRIEDEFRGQPNVSVKTLDEDDMKALGMGGILAVTQGSTMNPARIVVLEYDGTNGAQDRPLALVGKGVTFDTGGYNLKTGGGMTHMKTDMCGSAAVVGAMRALVNTQAQSKVVAIVGLAENMIDGHAFRPSDVITMYNGSTVEIGNTDAEGRLILADCMTYIQREFNPHTVLDIATLTGAMVAGLGDVYTGVFSNNDELWHKLDTAGEQTGEQNWRMPVLHEAFANAVKGNVADLSNTGYMNGAGASTAAAFLHAFLEDDPDGAKRAWAHLDIAGTSRKAGGVTGVGARMLHQFAVNDSIKADAPELDLQFSTGQPS